MTERDYIVVSALQRLRAALSLSVDARPVEGVHDARDKDRYDEMLRTLVALIGDLEGEVERLRAEDEDEDE